MKTIKSLDKTQESADFSSLEWLSQLAITKHQEGKIEEAIAYYLEIIALNPQQPSSLYVNLISLMTKIELLDKAIKIGHQALEIHPHADEIYSSLGIVFGKQKEFTQSIQHYQHAIQLESLQPEWVFINLAKTLLHINQSQQALKICQAGLQFYAQSDYLIKIHQQILINQSNSSEIDNVTINSKIRSNSQEQLVAKNIFLLNEHIIYLECNLNQDFNLNQITITSSNYHQNNELAIYCFTLEKKCLSLIISLAQPVNFNCLNLLLVSPQQKANLVLKNIKPAYGLEFIEYINSQPNYHKCLFKEKIIYGIIKNNQQCYLSSSQELITKLQSFIQIAPQLSNNPNQPFSIHFDSVIPIQHEGLFLRGWMSDPFKMVEEIKAISSLGFSISVQDAIHYLDRPDIHKAIKQTSYQGINQQLGIIAYIPFAEAIKQEFAAYNQQSNFRFQIKLKGNIMQNIIPKTVYYSGYSGINNILNSFIANQDNRSLLNNCIAPATLALGKACSQEFSVTKVQTIGNNLINDPIASIVIPISQNFDLFKIQFAILANDTSLRNSELIYVLSSIDQQHQWEKTIESYSFLYDLPVKLITTKLGNNYGALINAGIQESKSDLCISMLPDVLPKTDNWVGKIADFYQGLSNPGVLTPKLIYEDLSIQHAGMTYEQDYAGDWNYKHFYQGLSSNYPLAQNNRPVPAVNGACMVFNRQLYQQVDGLTAQYLASDSEATDLCFKSLELGYQNWYFSEVEMYYFEKQNKFTEFINQYNLKTQSKKWHDLMIQASNHA